MTPDQLLVLRQLCSKGLSLQNISDLMGIPPNKVRWQVRKHGLKTVNEKIRPLEQAREIYKHSCEHRLADTAKHFNITRHAVQNIRRTYLKRVRLNTRFADDPAHIFQRALRYGKRRNPEQANEFASWLCVKLLEGHPISGDLSHRWADFLREKFGRSDAKQEFTRGSVSMNYGDPTPSYEPVCGPSHDKISEILGNVITDKFERILIYLVFQFGFTLKEIGSMINVSEVRVHHIVNQVLSRLR